MRKILLFVALCISAMSFAASIGAPASINFGTYNMYGFEELTDSLEITLNPSGISDWGIGVEVVDDAEGIFWASDSWLYANGTPDWHGVKKAKVYFYVIEAGTYTATLRLSDYNSAYDEGTGIYAVHEDVALSVTIINEAPVMKEYELISTTGGLKEGDVVVFANASATKVANAHSNTYLSVVNATFTGNKLQSTEAMEFTVGKANGNWTFTNNGQLLGGDDKSLKMGSGVTEWTVSISDGEAEIKPSGSTYPIMFNTDRFKLYNPATTTYPLAQLYKVKTATVDIDNVETRVESQKVLRDGRLYIIRGEHMYDATGAMVR